MRDAKWIGSSSNTAARSILHPTNAGNDNSKGGLQRKADRRSWEAMKHSSPKFSNNAASPSHRTGEGAFGFDPNIVEKSDVTDSDRDVCELREKICFRAFVYFVVKMPMRITVAMRHGGF